jgi:diaminohydroxyphosphoribosylaminopyrimidine deaminase/5-amino-6-(5-phosphoribosylamino)uracil reductase
MSRALALAEHGLYTTTPNPRVGCVIVKDGVRVGEGWHERAGAPHAEVNALADAAARRAVPRGATLYVTLEPCNHTGRTPPCTDAVISAGIARVVAATLDPNTQARGGADRLRAAGIAFESGLLDREARELNIGFFSRMKRGRPWVRMKVAASLDGRTALASGESQWITGEEARADGHRWRARACAVLTGIGTVRSDNPQLTVRAVPTTRQPRRIVVDRHAETSAGARVFTGEGALMVTAGERNPEWPANAEVLTLPDAEGRVDLAAMMVALGRRGINEVHVEGGARLNGALLAAGLVDELLVYLAPCLIFDPALGMAQLPEGLARLADRIPLKLEEVAQIGADLRLRLRTIGGEG